MNYFRLLFLFFLVVLNYCSDSSKISYGIREFPTNLDPSFGLSFDESQISSQIYENLIVLDKDCESLNPHLAVSWNISKDKCVYTFVLRKNVYFHDVAKLSSYSVLKTFEWLREKEGKSEIYDKIKYVHIIDSLTFQFVLNEPYSIFLYVLASPESFQVMSEHALNKFGSSIGQHPVGTGPFYLSKWVESEEIILKKFDKYWGNHGELDKIFLKYYDNTFEREKELAKNNIDILYIVSSYSVDRLKWTGYIDYHTLVPVNIFFLGFNNKSYPFNDKRIRKAVLEAINIPRFVHSSSRGKAIVAKGPLPPNYYNYNEKVQDGFDFMKAKKVLNELGITKLKVNFDFPQVTPTRKTKIEFLKHELDKIGIFLNVCTHNSWEKFDRAISSDSAQVFYNGGRSDIIGDALNFLYGFFYSTSEFNTLNYNEPMIDKWIDEAFLEHDPKKRRSLYEKIVNKILEDTPAIFLLHTIPNLAYNTKKIKKLITNPYGVIQFHKIELF